MLFLAVFVTTGMDLSVVRANAMAVKMAMMPDMAPGHDGCKNCPEESSKDGAKGTTCVTGCVAPAMIHQYEAARTIMGPATTIYLPSLALLRGRALRPDPHPPRPSDIG